MSDRYVILDRDGTLNIDSDDFIKSPEEWLPLPGSLEAVALLNRQGYRTVIITNQSGIARGLFDLATLEAIHTKMRRMVSDAGGTIDSIYFCPHGPGDRCDCRKPQDGLFRRFAQASDIDLRNVYAIGDSYRDIEAAAKAGARPILVRTGKGEKTEQQHPELIIPIFNNLYDAAHFIVTQS